MPDKEAVVAEIRKKYLAYQHVFSSPEGRTVLEDLKQHFYNPSMIVKKNGVVEPYTTVALCGSRDVVVHILDILGQDIGEEDNAVDR